MQTQSIRSAIAACAALALFAAPSTPVHAQAYPNHPLKLIVPFPPGGATDTLARSIAQKLTDSLGQPVVIDNRPGAGGNIGLEAAVRAPADGHTLVMVATATMAINPTLYRNLSFDAGRDLAPVSFIAYVPNILVVNPAVPASNLAELIAYLKANPGKLNFASPGSGNSSHLAGEMFKQRAGVDIAHVPYKGDAPAFTDLIGGQVQMMFAIMVTAAPHIKAGRLRPIALAGVQRASNLPDVPTLSESGLPGFDAGAWFGVATTAGTPRDAIDRLNAEINKVLQLTEIQERLAPLGATPTRMTVEQFTTLVKDEREKWGKLIRDSGAKVD
ncbi:MAG: tripartite tricarboxylate transporter substrate binding protein [Betaproteobacteria bacterium]|nr:tripartite tricarboxylate transporter substrate binding protein [Betaproteobacteria bacterium]